MKKLESFNLNTDSVEYIKSYLNNRTQVSNFGKYTSSEEKIMSGVPQRSILGPFLFLCLVNDLPNVRCLFILEFDSDDTYLLSAKTARPISVVDFYHFGDF